MKIVPLTLFVFLLITIKTYSEDDFIHFPDPYFKKILVNMGYCGQPIIDLNGDGEIQYSEAAAYEDRLWFYCEWTDSITDFTGIKEFINIKKLYLDNCSEINELDVSGMVNLEEIRLFRVYHLEKVNISGCKNLEEIDCTDNNINYLNAENCSKLKTIWCSINNIENLNLFNCTSLKSLGCGKNNLENIEFNECKNLEGINCSYNKLTKLDFSPLTNFKRLAGNNNQLIKVNMHNGNNNSITQFNTSGNSNLKCITVDDPTYSKEHWKEIDEWTEFSEYCSSDVNEIRQNIFKFYPNPTNNTVLIERTNSEPEDLRILDITGRISVSYTIPYGEKRIRLDVSRLSAGAYIIEINNETKSLIIE